MWLVATLLDDTGLESKLGSCILAWRTPTMTRKGSVYSVLERFRMTQVLICFCFASTQKALSNLEALVKITET